MSIYQAKDKRTKSYLEAVGALEALLKSDGLDSVQRAVAETTVEEMKNQVSANYHWSNGHACITRLQGHQCNYIECSPPGADHSFMLTRDRKPFRFVTHPYNLDMTTVKEMVEFADKHNLHFYIDGFSWWFPGRTVRVIWSKIPVGL